MLISQTWRVAKSENSAALLRKVLAASGDLGPPIVTFLAMDSPVGAAASATARAVKKFPEVAPLATDVKLPGATEAIPGLSNAAADGRLPIAMDLLLAVLDGVPRSFPFHQVGVTLQWPPPESAQLHIGDMWWVNGRMRSLTLLCQAEADTAAKKAPAPGPAIQALVEALGKPKSTAIEPADVSIAGPSREFLDIVQRYRSRLDAHSATLVLPHAFVSGGVGHAAGPMKPALVAAFGPRGFECRGESGAFFLRRRTPSNHVVELSLDVGTWSHSFTGFLLVHVPGYRATLPLMVGHGVRQAAIAGADGWLRLVENLCVVVDDLERTFVAEIEAVAGPAPGWFEPGR